MPEPDDELARLRAADPLDQASLPSASDRKARALFERITMSDTTTDTTDATPGSPPTEPRRRALLLVAAAAAVMVALLAGAVMLANDDPDPSQDVATPSDSDAPISPGGATGSCVAVYDLETLADRDVAFDGTVESVAGDEVTFSVNRWYKESAGAGEAVTLSGAQSLSAITSAGPSAPLEPGTRLLVAGDGGFAWGCGFTQPYDPAVADQWEDVFAG